MAKEAGRLVICEPGAGRGLTLGTLQCVHCGGQWVTKPGSGNIRGFCQRCAGPVCGPSCVECVPTEQLLENIEAGRPLDYTRIIVAT